MIEITGGTLEEKIIKQLQKTYPITIKDLEDKVHVSRARIIRVLQQLQINGVVQLESLSDKTYIRLLRFDIKFVTKKRQKKFIKHKHQKRHYDSGEDDSFMYG
jgi:predicted transcriptional regulator